MRPNIRPLHFSKADKDRVMLPKAAVICALLALFSAGSQGNKEANVGNNHRAAQKEPFLPFDDQPTVFRRDSRTCLPRSDEYYRRLALLLCNEKYIQAVISEIETSNCTNEHYDIAFFYGCGTNHNGDMCAHIQYSTYDHFYYPCLGPLETNECSSGCQTELRQLSDSVGCCIHANDEARMPSLLMNCNIQQPEVCADTPNIADALAKKRNVGLCTHKCSLRQTYYVFCKNLGEEYEKLNRDCGMDNAESFCGFHNGEFCAAAAMDFLYSYHDIIFECHNVSDGVCSTNCRNVLGEFIDTVDCCFQYFNSSNFYLDQVLSSDLFSACDIEVPDACNSTTVPDDFLECVGNSTNNSGAALQVYAIGLIIIALIGTYIY